MSRASKHWSGILAEPSSGVGKSSRVEDSNDNSKTRATDTEIDRGVPSWSAAVNKTRYADVMDNRRFCVMFSDRSDLVMFDGRNIRRDTDISACNRKWTLLQG